MTQVLLIVVSLLFGGLSECGAFYLVPYEIRVPTENSEPDEPHTALVVLPDHFAHYFGPQDELQQLMVRGFFENSHPNVRAYLQGIGDRYFDSFLESAEAYGGKAIAKKIVKKLKDEQPVVDPLSSYLIISRGTDLMEPIVHVRITPRAENGLLPFESHYLGAGLEKALSNGKVDKCLVEVPVWRPQPSQPNFFRLDPADGRVLIEAAVGDSVELKNYRMDPRSLRRFHPFLRQLGERHRIYRYGTGQLEEEGHEGGGIHVDQIFVEAWGDAFKRVYEQILGFKEVARIQNKGTFGQTVYILKGTPEDLETGPHYEGRHGDHWIVYNSHLLDVFRHSHCGDRLERNANTLGKKHG